MSTKNMGRTTVQGGHYSGANMKFRLHRRRERALAKAYCRDPEHADGATIPEARRMKHWLCWDDIHCHHWRLRLDTFFLAHLNRPAEEALRKLERRHHRDSYQDRMIRKEAREYLEFASKYDWYDFVIDEDGIIRAPEDCIWFLP